MNVRFGIFTDLHTELIHDSVSRLRVALAAFEEAKCDFCVELGDFCPPGDRNLSHKKQIRALIDSLPLPLYHTLGNHDMDQNEKEEVVHHLGMEAASYSFDRGGVHFVVLDACHYQEGDRFLSYDKGNYKKASDNALLPILPPDVLAWLKDDLQKTTLPSVLFSHQSLIESRAGIQNANTLREVIKNAPNGVLLAACGHEHVDRLEKQDGVYYWCVNSASYYWAGGEFKHTTYGEEIEEQFHTLRYVFPYRDPLFAIVEINDNEIRITGTSSEFVGATPEEMDFQKKGLADPVLPYIQDRLLAL